MPEAANESRKRRGTARGYGGGEKEKGRRGGEEETRGGTHSRNNYCIFIKPETFACQAGTGISRKGHPPNSRAILRCIANFTRLGGTKLMFNFPHEAHSQHRPHVTAGLPNSDKQPGQRPAVNALGGQKSLGTVSAHKVEPRCCQVAN